jgi:glycosyltransferase involved in cell wall biosynthesis
MGRFSIVLTACNNAAVVREALQSVEDALAFLRATALGLPPGEAEVVVIDDGSTDATNAIIQGFTRGKDLYRVVRTGTPTSPACARNRGVALSSGEILFFLDADDKFLPVHLAEGLKLLKDSGVNYLRMGVRMADPVHPDWKERIENSLVINLCVRRSCHDFIGGFPDYHLVTRHSDEFRHCLDVFYKIEDIYYNQALHTLFRGARMSQETVEYRRHPGNSYDRQYEKFRRPYGTFSDPPDALVDFRYRLAGPIFDNYLRELRARLAERQNGSSLETIGRT